MSTLAVVEEILRETKFPMSVRQIVEYADGRLPTKSKTPDTVVARDLSMDIKKKGEQSLFIRTAPGRYTIREIHLQNLQNLQNLQTQANQETEANRIAGEGGEAKAAESAVERVGINVTSSTGNGAAERVTEPAASGLSDVQADAAGRDDEATSMLSSAMRTERVGTLPAKTPASSELGHQASTK